MGIFPEIDRAWMTIDNKLFLWDFKERCVRLLALFEALSGVLMSFASSIHAIAPIQCRLQPL